MTPAPRRALAWLAVVAATVAACASAPTRRRVPTPPSLVSVAGGCFVRGAPPEDCDASPAELPAREICVAPFSIGRFEVTRGEWRDVMGAPAPSGGCDADDCPVGDVTWQAVQDFLARLNAATGGRYRLPTEAEWEYAARSGGRGELFAGGRLSALLAWSADDSGLVGHPVGRKEANGLGLHDMSGNVWELTGDWYDPRWYALAPAPDPAGPRDGVERAVRGGSFRDPPRRLRTTSRAGLAELTRGAGRAPHVGFRLAASP